MKKRLVEEITETAVSKNDIAELITRRRRQVLIHSIIYYRMNENIISDEKWAEWALELETLQKEHPDIAATCPYAEGFKDFDHSTGMNLPLDDSWAVRKATQLLEWRKSNGR